MTLFHHRWLAVTLILFATVGCSTNQTFSLKPALEGFELEGLSNEFKMGEAVIESIDNVDFNSNLEFIYPRASCGWGIIDDDFKNNRKLLLENVISKWTPINGKPKKVFVFSFPMNDNN